jgi:hypothetical protein
LARHFHSACHTSTATTQRHAHLITNKCERKREGKEKKKRAKKKKNVKAACGARQKLVDEAGVISCSSRVPLLAHATPHADKTAFSLSHYTPPPHSPLLSPSLSLPRSLLLLYKKRSKPPLKKKKKKQHALLAVATLGSALAAASASVRRLPFVRRKS